jgi:osmotically-inducible protein OsmY
MRDHALERRIAEALAADPRVDDDTIAVECGESGYAVLRGSAASPAKDTRALRTASAVSGVDGVNNQLRPRRLGVGPRHDARTEAAVLRAFIADDALPAETMHVSASDGTVTLRGRVDFAYQRDEAEAVARRVPGVSQLRNELDVWTALSPNQVLEQVTGAMDDDRADRLTVTARDNVVTLSGTVRSAADRDAAVAAAADVPFVARVEDEIRVVA